MRIALISLDQVWKDKKSNFSRCDNFVRHAAERDCDLVVFPEMTLTGYSMEMTDIAEPVSASETLEWFAALATDVGIDIVFGACLIDSEKGRPSNSLCFAGSGKGSRAVYTKMHPFSFAGEDLVMDAGDSLAVIESGNLRLGCAICYDLRFPEPFSVMSPNCDALVVIANWPARRVAHWRALLIARAIENQCFVFGVNRIGTDGNGLQYEKSTLVVAPDGSLVVPEETGREMDVYLIDSEEVKRYREEFPTVRDKRFDLYRRFLER